MEKKATERIIYITGSEKPEQARQVNSPFDPMPLIINNHRIDYKEPFIEKPRKKRRQDLFKK